MFHHAKSSCKTKNKIYFTQLQSIYDSGEREALKMNGKNFVNKNTKKLLFDFKAIYGFIREREIYSQTC
jgi:hypothetical protein